MAIIVRRECPADVRIIDRIVERAFAAHPRSLGTEARIVRGLREAGALTVSLVVERDGQVSGHVAVSPVQMTSHSTGWHGLGPVAVDPACQRQGLGVLMITACLEQVRHLGSSGCVVLGHPDYYGRFGFKAMSGVAFAGAPPGYFMVLPFASSIPNGEVTYHAAFSVQP